MSQPEEDFATLFAASTKAARYTRGQTIEGTLVAIGAEVALVNVGGKGEAQMDVADLKDADGDIAFSVGDRIQATVTSTTGGVMLSRKAIRGAASQRQLLEAFQAGLSVEGKVENVNKGGYEVRIGSARAFCPLSQIDIVRTADPATHVGRAYTFRIVEYRDEGRSVVVSRRALLEDEQRAKADTLRRSIVPGAIVTGRVISVRDFGAFVDLGAGVQGLLHVSEMSWSRVANAAKVVGAGDEITVKVLRVDEATQKISLGLRQLTDDPWLAVQAKYAIGQIRSGRVTRVADFGAFVELEPGIEALAHASTFAPTGQRDGWAKRVPVGATAEFEIVAIDTDQKRIGISLIDGGLSRAEVREYVEQAEATPAQGFGSLADKFRDAIDLRRR